MKTVLVLCLSCLPFAAMAQTTTPTCTAATLTGTRALALTGRDLSATAVVSQTYQAVGTATFDGVSAVTFTLTTTTNAVSAHAQTLAGSYTLPSTCVGTLTLTSGDSASFTLIVYNQGNGFTITGQDGTYVFAGTGSPQPVSCITSTLSGTYAFSGNGYSLTSGAVTGLNGISGLLQFDGRGGITATWSIATNGSSTSDTLTGNYSVTGSCLASATLTDSSAASFPLNLTVTSVDGADFALDIANPTAAFSANGHAAFTNPGLAVSSAASGTGNATPPGSIFALYGSGMTTGSTQANSLPLPTALLSATVTVNGEAAPLFYASSGQMNAQMPWDIQPGMATVVVKNGSGTSNSVAVNVPALGTPEMFVYGSNRAVVQNPNLTVNSSSAPAHVGETVVGYFTGGGPVTPAAPLASGKASPNGLSPVTGTPVSVTVGGVAATVNYIGLTPTEVGLYQVNFVIPQVAVGDRTVVITIGAFASAGTIITVAN